MGRRWSCEDKKHHVSCKVTVSQTPLTTSQHHANVVEKVNTKINQFSWPRAPSTDHVQAAEPSRSTWCVS